MTKLSTITDFDNTHFLNLIKGLKYDKDTDEYKFNKKKYKLRNIVKATTFTKEFTKSNAYIFYNVENAGEFITVFAVRGIPTFDGFNNVKIDEKTRRSYYFKTYYNKVLIKRRHERARIRKEIKQEYRKALIEQRRLDKEAEKLKKLESIQPIKCEHCGKLFKPTQKTQIFCSRECYAKHSSHVQYLKVKEALRETKICPVCGKEFVGTPRVKYCSKECRLQNAKTKRS